MIPDIETVKEYCSWVVSHPRESLLLACMTGCFFMSEYNRNKSITQRKDSGQKRKAQHPKVPKEFIKTRPEGLTLGIIEGWRKRYMVIPQEGKSNSHVLIVGGTGSGKSVTLLNSCLNMAAANREAKKNGVPQKYHLLFVDPKGEINHIAMRDALMLDPDTRSSFGWDFYHLINKENPSDDLINKTMECIADCFIPESKENSFFVQNAKSLLIGCLIFFRFHKKIGFVDSVLKLLTTDIKEILKECYDEIDEDDLAYSWLGKFKGEIMSKSPSEAFMNFYSEMTTNLSCFRSSDVIWALRDNPNKLNVTSVVEDGSVGLKIDPSKLNEAGWAPILRAIYSTEMQYLISDSNVDGRPNICLMLDEYYVISKPGGLPGIESFISISRSYKCYIIAAVQTIAQINEIHGATGKDILLSNFRIQLYLEATDEATSKRIIESCGKFFDRQISVSSGNRNSSSSSISWQERNIFEASELATLSSTGHLLVVTNIGHKSFYFLKKLLYFKDPYYKKLLKELQNEK